MPEAEGWIDVNCWVTHQGTELALGSTANQPQITSPPQPLVQYAVFACTGGKFTTYPGESGSKLSIVLVLRGTLCPA